MDLRKKINLRRYFLLSALSTVVCLFLAHGWTERLAILAIYVATILNQLLLTWAVMKLITPFPPTGTEAQKKEARRKRTTEILLAFAGKLGVLLVGLSLGVHFMGPRVIIPLLNYVIQIFILVFSFKRKAEE